MRKFAILFFSAVMALSVYAGDVASFVNLGFSADGSRFVFGQYGKTDGEYRAYADIFSVDVAKNEFLRDGAFSTAPSAVTAGADARGVFAALQNTAAAYLAKQGIDSARQGRSLYIQAEDEPRLKKLSFRDFETGASYEVTVNTLVEGIDAAVSSCFYIMLDITAADGKKSSRTVGLPGFARAGVKDYLIRRIITDASGKSLVFVIEKEVWNKSGSSVRFMVETVRL